MTNIHKSLANLARPIGDLLPDPGNARRHTDRNLDAIAASLRAFGQRKPIVVQRVGGGDAPAGLIIRAGHGTVKAALRLGWTSIAAVVIEEGDVTATAYALADNRTAELAEWDDAALAVSLGAVREGWDAYDPMTMGFEEADVIKLLADHGVLYSSADLDLDLDLDDAESDNAPPTPPAPRPADIGVAPTGEGATQMVQLFLTNQQHPIFLAAIRKLAAHFGISDVSTAVYESVIKLAAEVPDE